MRALGLLVSPRGWRGSAEKESLAVSDAELEKRLELLAALDPFGDDRRAHLIGERFERADHFPAHEARVEMADETDVELQVFRVQPSDALESRIA